MKKIYVSPAIEAASVQAHEEILAGSFGKYTDPKIPGPTGYAKKDNWDIFGEDTVEEE